MRYISKLLLRKITLFDWIFIVLSAIALVFFYLFFKRDVTYITARFKVTDENILYATSSPGNEFASSFRVGDTEKDELGRTISEIVGVEAYKTIPEQQKIYLDIKLKAIYNPRTNQYTVRGKNILFGESLTFSFTKVRFKALVVDFPGFRDQADEETKKTIVKTQVRHESRGFSDVYGVPSFLADAVNKDDEVIDSKGNVLIKVIDKTVKPARRLVVNNSGQPFIVDDPYLKDVYYTLEISTREINGATYMFDYIPVLINSVVPMNFKSVSVWPTITEIVK